MEPENSYPQQVDETTDQLHHNLTAVLDRQLKLDDFVDRAEQLNIGAANFSQDASKVKKKMWYNNIKMWIIIIIVIIVIITIIAVWVSVAKSNSTPVQTTTTTTANILS
ncbi:hypothetical protein GJ496_000130 [Pomphorhynchus laevis]|nr:hypothetical protein GJ496_000130 [Pomphorhynchus laevis]